MAKAGDDFSDRVDCVEQAYEYLLAYAAQGHTAVTAAGKDGEARRHLERARGAIDGIAGAARDAAAEHPAADGILPFVDVLERDATAAGAALALVLAQSAVSSQLVDNLNASSHVRALLTDLFLLDEALGLGPTAG